MQGEGTVAHIGATDIYARTKMGLRYEIVCVWEFLHNAAVCSELPKGGVIEGEMSSLVGWGEWVKNPLQVKWVGNHKGTVFSRCKWYF